MGKIQTIKKSETIKYLSDTQQSIKASKEAQVTEKICAHPILRTSVVDVAAVLILNYIKENNLEIGQKLPSERDLAKFFDVSRSSLREAIKGLVFAGILEATHGRGTFVRSRPQYFKDFQHESEALVYQSDMKKHLMYVETRMIIEPNAAEIVASKITQDQLDELERILVRNQQNLDTNNIGACGIDDMDFHTSYIKILHNPIIYKAMQNVWNTMPDYYMNFIRIPELAKGSFEQHVAIYNAFKNHDPHLVKELMVKHVNYYSQMNCRFYKTF